MADKPLREMTDDELQTEWRRWDACVAGATGWGAGLAVANAFRRDCLREMARRRLRSLSSNKL